MEQHTEAPKMAAVPASCRSDVDLFARETLIDPYPSYKELRDIGRVAYMNKHDLWAVTRYDEVKNVLADPDTFTVRFGNTLNPIVNKAWQGAAAVLEREEHARLARVMKQHIGPKAVAEYQEKAEHEAALLVDELLDREEFDAVTDMAHALPVNVALDIIGVPREDDNRNRLLMWASDTYNCCAPESAVDEASYQSMEKLYGWAREHMSREKLLPNGIGRMTWDAVDAGRLTDDEAWGIIVGYVTAGLDTTATAIGNLMMLLVENPDQWNTLRDDPSLVRSAILEALRMESPAQWFSKKTARDVEFDDVVIPEGEWLVHFYGAGNRDERHYDDPDRFDVKRNPMDHLSFGHGVHTCAGKHLSYMEKIALFGEMVRRVERIELCGEPVRHVHNVMRGLEHLPVRIYAR